MDQTTKKGVIIASSFVIFIFLVGYFSYSWFIKLNLNDKNIWIQFLSLIASISLMIIVAEIFRIITLISAFHLKFVLLFLLVLAEFFMSFLFLLLSMSVVIFLIEFLTASVDTHRFLLVLFSGSFALSLVLYISFLKMNVAGKVINFDFESLWRGFRFLNIPFKEDISIALNEVEDQYVIKTVELIVLGLTIFSIINATASNFTDNNSPQDFSALFNSINGLLLLVTLTSYTQYIHHKYPVFRRKTEKANVPEQTKEHS